MPHLKTILVSAGTTLLIIAIATRIAPLKKIVFNEGA
jgi:hypothetical protein